MRLVFSLLMTFILPLEVALHGQSLRESIVLDSFVLNVSGWDYSDGLPASYLGWMQRTSAGSLFFSAPKAGIYSFDGIRFKSVTLHGDSQMSVEGSMVRFFEDNNQNVWIIIHNGQNASLRQLLITNKFGDNPVSLLDYTGVSLDTLNRALGKKILLFHDKNLLLYSTTQPVVWEYDGCFRNSLSLKGYCSNCYAIPIAGTDFFLLHDLEKGNLRVIDVNGKAVEHSGAIPHQLDSFYQPYFTHSIDDVLTLSRSYSGSSFAIKFINDTLTVLPKSSIRQLLRINGDDEWMVGLGKRADGEFSGVDQLDIYLSSIKHKVEINLDELLGDVLGLTIKPLPTDVVSNSFWLKSNTHLLRVEIRQNIFSQPDINQQRNSIRSINQLKDGKLLISAYESTFILDPEDLTAIEIFPPDQVIYSTQSVNNQLWMGTERGLFLSDQDNYSERASVEHPNGIFIIYDIDTLEGGNLLFASDKGLWEHKISEKKYEAQGLNSKRVFTILKSAEEGTFVGTQDGLYNLDRQQYLITKHPIFDIKEDRPGHFWLASKQGLLEWELGWSEPKLHLGNFILPNNRLHCVYPDGQGNLWMSSNDGLLVYDPVQIRHKYFYQEDGLPGNEFNLAAHYQNAAGELFFGGVNGLVKVDPAEFSWGTNAALNPMQWQEIIGYDYQDNIVFKSRLDTVTTQAAVSIPSSVFRVEIGFNFANYDQEFITKEWRLSGEETWWPIVGLNRFSFRLTEFGPKELSVRVYNSSLKGLEQQLRLVIDKRTPLYQSWGFIILATSLVGVLVFGLGRYFRQREQEKLRSLVVEKTATLEEQASKIITQKETLEAVLVNRNKLFRNFSHDFRTPLFVVKAIIEKIEQDYKIPLGARNKLITVNENVQTLTGLTEQIANLTTLDSQKLELQKSWVEWGRLCQKSCTNVMPLAEQKGVELKIPALPQTLHYVELDLLKTEQILRNLLDNAIKFTPAGGVIEFSTQVSNKQITLQIEDSGPGVADAERERIFSRFEQGKAAAADYQTGLGLGLSFCKEYLQLMQGTIEVADSRLGGACFTVQIPQLNIQDQAPSTTAYPAGNISASIVYNHKKPTLLIAEDNLDLLQLYQESLAPQFSLLLARNGKHALELLDGTHLSVSLFVLDVMMPEMGGLELLEKLKTHDKYALTPVIFVTALTEMQFKIKSLRMGVDAYLMKPFSIDELEARINNLLAYKKQRENDLQQELSTTLRTPPNSSPKTSMDYNDVWLEELAEAVLDKLIDPKLKINAIAQSLNLSERTLRERIKRLTGLKPNEYINKMRLAKALKLLEERKYKTVSEVCYRVGMNTPSHFSRLFKEEYGRLPSSYF